MSRSDIDARIESQNKEFDAVAELCKAYKSITLTPVVDDDYPSVRNVYENRLKATIEALKANGRLPAPASVVEELEKTKSEIRRSMSFPYLMQCHKEVESRLADFVKAVCEFPDKNQRLFQRLLLLSIVDAYQKGRFDR